MAKAKSNSKPKTFMQVSHETTREAQASRDRIKRNPVQGNMQKSARVAAQKRKTAVAKANKTAKRYTRGTAK